MGINNIPPKICTYSCIYCQVGRTMNMQIDRESFYKPDDIVKAVRQRVEENRRINCIKNFRKKTEEKHRYI